MSGGPARRFSPSEDATPKWTQSEFLKRYGKQEGERQWQLAAVTRPDPDAPRGPTYTLREFVQYYGREEAERRWALSGKATAKAEQKAGKAGSSAVAEEEGAAPAQPVKATAVQLEQGPAAAPLLMATTPIAGRFRERPPVSDKYGLSGGVVRACGAQAWWSCTLSQTVITGTNNVNKYFIMQLIDCANGSVHAFQHSGRVGDPGIHSHQAFSCLQGHNAEEWFCQKFQQKTGNGWEAARAGQFVKKGGKNMYTLLENVVGEEEPDEEQLRAASKSKAHATPALPPLPPQLRSTLSVILNEDMFNEELKALNVDLKQLPLGKLSRAQLRRGRDVLDAIDRVLQQGDPNMLPGLSSQYYTAIPHAFAAHMKPPVLESASQLQREQELLDVLMDVEVGASMLAAAGGVDPIAASYATLGATLEPLEAGDELTAIQSYVAATMGGRVSVADAFRLERHGEAERARPHDALGNRRLLWHGTNVAVVAAILKGGLRIMPHAGGRVGRGLYFASECSKSYGYVSRSGHTGFMFLAEVALGRISEITKDNGSLRAPPAGYNSVKACGRTEPQPSLDLPLCIGGREVVMPRGAPTATEHRGSSFHQSEYLVYDESQVQLRYLVRLQC